MSEGAGGDMGQNDAGESPFGVDASGPPRSITTAAGTVSYGGASSSPNGASGNGATGNGSANGNGVSGGNGGAGNGQALSGGERRRAKRLAYWNRAKPPKDWRYWVGGTGRILIVLGLLMFAFVAYQLWGTGIEQARAQNALDNELEATRAELGTVPVLIPPTTTAPPATVPGEVPPDTTVPTVTEAPTLSLPAIEEGDAIGVLHIERIGMDQKVVAGVGVADLKKGPGHFPQTTPPGTLGNAAIAGHRTTFGGPFLHLDELEVGDPIVWEDLYGQRFTYLVTGTEVVNPSDGYVINTTDRSIAKLTLTTCTPVRTSKQRLIIYAELDLTQSPAPTANNEFYGQAPPADGVVTELPGDEAVDPAAATTLPGGETVATDAATTLPGETATPASDPSTVPATDVATTEPAATTTAPVTTIDASTDRPAGFSDADPFAQGWFSDDAAWPQVAAWGLALIALCLACYALARALMRRWVGWVVAAAPFVVLLYFFFQNVNRLLPPGL